MIRRLAFILIYCIPLVSWSQAEKRVLSSTINQPGLNAWAPAISGDGNTLVFLTDYSRDGHHSMYYSEKKGSQWTEPVEVDRVVNNPNLNYRGGYSLSFDGDEIYFTSSKTGLGGYEIWRSKRQGSSWLAPSNLGKPVNSASNEGTPSLSPDGQELYFMRCDKMSEYGGASGCKLYVSKIKYGKWQEPELLPDNINSGDTQNPNILADGRTLIFASNKPGGKGGLDLYMSKKVENTWQDPIAMDYLNTADNDQFVTVDAKGRYLIRAESNGKDHDLVQLLIPAEFKPQTVMRVRGKVTDEAGNPVKARLTVFDVDLRDRIWNESLSENGEFILVLNEGSTYDVTVSHPDPAYKYFAKVYSLEEVGRRDRETLDISLRPMVKGDEYEAAVLFESFGTTLDDRSTYELRRLTDLLRKNEHINIELAVGQTNYQQDSIRSSSDLTEITYDSLLVKKKIAVIDTAAEIQTDSLTLTNSGDSLSARPNPTFIEVEEWEVKTTYHNDRTEAQSKALVEYLTSKGVSPDRISVRTYRAARPDSAEISEDTHEDVYVTIKILQI